MLEIIAVALVFGYFLLVWLRTNAFVEYMTLLGLKNYCHVGEYAKLQSEGYSEVYTQFLAEYYYNQFFIRLIICPVCLSFWLGILTSLCLYDFVAFLVAPLMLFFYLVFNRML